MDQVTADQPCTLDHATVVSDTTTTEAGSTSSRVAQESSTLCGCGRTTNTETDAHTRAHAPTRRRDGHGWRRGHVLAAAVVGFVVGQCSWYSAVQRVREAFLHRPLGPSNTTLTGAHTTSAPTPPLPPASPLGSSSSPLSPPSSTSSLFSPLQQKASSQPPPSSPSPSSSSSPPPPPSSPTSTMKLTLEEFDKRVDERIRKYVEREVLDRVYPLQASMSELRRAYESSCPPPPHQQHPHPSSPPPPPPPQQQQPHPHDAPPPYTPLSDPIPPSPHTHTAPPPHTEPHDAHTHTFTDLDTRLRALEARVETLSHAHTHSHTHTQGGSGQGECVCVTEKMLGGGDAGVEEMRQWGDVEGRVGVLERRWDAVNNVTMALMLRMDVHEEEVREMRSEMEAVWFDGFLDTRQALRRIEEVDRRIL